MIRSQTLKRCDEEKDCEEQKSNLFVRHDDGADGKVYLLHVMKQTNSL